MGGEAAARFAFGQAGALGLQGKQDFSRRKCVPVSHAGMKASTCAQPEVTAPDRGPPLVHVLVLPRAGRCLRNHQHVAGGVIKDVLRHAAEQVLFHRAAAVPAEHDDIRRKHS